MEKDSFLMYKTWWEQIQFLSDEQAGVLLKAIFASQWGMELPQMDSATQICLMFIKQQMSIDASKYDAVCEKRKEAGRKGAAARWMANAKNANGKNSKRKNGIAKMAEYEYEYENEYDHDNDHDDDEERKIKERKRLEERDRILEEDDYALRHETDPNREHFFKPRVKLGWVGQDQEEEKAAVPDNRKPITQEEKDRILKRLEEFKKQRGY